MAENKPGINWKSIIAQALLFSATIYLPFFLENWNTDKKEEALNLQYKEFLKEDLKRDRFDLVSRLEYNKAYIDSLQSIFGATIADSTELRRRAFVTLLFGRVSPFRPTVDVGIFVEQFRQFGQPNDLSLVRGLNRLEQGFEAIMIAEENRYAYIKEYYTPIYLDHYMLRNGGMNPVDLPYFDSNNYLNIMGMFANLAFQVQVVYFTTYHELLKCLETLGEDQEMYRLKPEDFAIPGSVLGMGQ